MATGTIKDRHQKAVSSLASCIAAEYRFRQAADWEAWDRMTDRITGFSTALDIALGPYESSRIYSEARREAAGAGKCSACLGYGKIRSRMIGYMECRTCDGTGVSK